MNILCRSRFNHIQLDFRGNAIMIARMVKWLSQLSMGLSEKIQSIYESESWIRALMVCLP